MTGGPLTGAVGAVGNLVGFTLAYWEQSIIKVVAVLAVIPVAALLLAWMFLLKMMAHMQSRLGPMDPGGYHGWFQNIGDAVKFIQKEDIIPRDARVGHS